MNVRVNFLCSATTISMRTSSGGRTRAGRISLTGGGTAEPQDDAGRGGGTEEAVKQENKR